VGGRVAGVVVIVTMIMSLMMMGSLYLFAGFQYRRFSVSASAGIAHNLVI
jgi:hypothetical protein